LVLVERLALQAEYAHVCNGWQPRKSSAAIFITREANAHLSAKSAHRNKDDTQDPRGPLLSIQSPY
jgi:hypothetical protein